MDSNIYNPGPYSGTHVARRIPKGAGQGAGSIPASANPVPINLFYDSVLAADPTPNIRLSYTVPKDRRCQISHTMARCVRTVAAGVVQPASALIFMRRSGFGVNATSHIDLALAQLGTNNVNDFVLDKSHTIVELYEGDSIFLQTVDGSTGGSVDFIMGVWATEFDAIDRATRVTDISGGSRA